MAVRRKQHSLSRESETQESRGPNQVLAGKKGYDEFTLPLPKRFQDCR